MGGDGYRAYDRAYLHAVGLRRAGVEPPPGAWHALAIPREDFLALVACPVVRHCQHGPWWVEVQGTLVYMLPEGFP